MRYGYLGKPLARGRTADIFAWADGFVLKLFHPDFDLTTIKHEAHLARTIYASGVPSPAPGNIIEVNGRYGLVYQRVNGPTMLEALQRHPWRLGHYAQRFAALHAQIHSSVAGTDVPKQRESVERKIHQAAALPARNRAAILNNLKTLPDGDRLCHGDFHPGNVVLSDHGDVVIDWTDATCGNPLADVARSSILVGGALAGGQVANPLARLVVRLFDAAYRRHYFRLCPGEQQEYRRWLPIVAAARLSENIPELEKWLLEQAQSIG